MCRVLTAGAMILDDDVEIDLRTKSWSWTSLGDLTVRVEKTLGAIRHRKLFETA
jgi:hypothetical protein